MSNTSHLSVVKDELLLLRRPNRQEKAKYDLAYQEAIFQAGSLLALADELKKKTGSKVSHQSVRNWSRDQNIPVHWALMLEKYYGVDFFDLVPWLRERFKAR